MSRRVLLVFIFVLVGFIILFFLQLNLYLDRKKNVNTILKDCLVFQIDKNGEVATCGYLNILSDGEKVFVSRVFGIEKILNKLFLIVHRQERNKWVEEKIFIGNDDVSTMINFYTYDVPNVNGLSYDHKKFDRVNLSEAKKLLKERYGKEAILYLSGNNFLSIGLVKYQVLDTIVFYENN